MPRDFQPQPAKGVRHAARARPLLLVFFEALQEHVRREVAQLDALAQVAARDVEIFEFGQRRRFLHFFGEHALLVIFGFDVEAVGDRGLGELARRHVQRARVLGPTAVAHLLVAHTPG